MFRKEHRQSFYNSNLIYVRNKLTFDTVYGILKNVNFRLILHLKVLYAKGFWCISSVDSVRPQQKNPQVRQKGV